MVQNLGRLVNFVNGITGVAPGGNAVVNLPVNQRYHRLIFFCKAIAYSAAVIGTFAPAPATQPGGTPATFTVQRNNTDMFSSVRSVVVATAGAGQTPGVYNMTFTDPTGVGASATITVDADGTVHAAGVNVTSGGTASNVDPAYLLTSVKLLVNGVNMRDISAENILKIAIANLPVSDHPKLGELPIYFSQPWMEIVNASEANSWDLFGQSTFQIQLGIYAQAGLPSVTAVQEFDYFRNTVNVGGKDVPFLQPIAQHQFSWPIVSGRNDINTLPYNFPIERMWLQGSVAGAISQVEVFQDNNKILEALIEQLLTTYEEYGFNFGDKDWLNTVYGTQAAGAWSPVSNTLFGTYAVPRYFDAAFISDVDNRVYKALKCENSMILRVYSNVAQALTIVQETLPGQFA